MLVISRKCREGIDLGEEISVTVLSVRSDSVRLGVVAPRQVQVKRSELQEWVARSNQASAELSPQAWLEFRSSLSKARMTLPVLDLEDSLEFYVRLGFHLSGRESGRLLLENDSVVLELRPGKPRPGLGFSLCESGRWARDPNGYRVECNLSAETADN
jgi:carbon storage regulator|eukprot:TRINITY_DN55393_c0_g1_i1.p2 TRINITY_DN55393_c0_g1~~TRINITY_DN55393_c0_g1_i1.p2  ORF type:complete len:158 (+),score=17.03 TRINITY_DN55393_c0_g1_i1:400-873(+)